MNATPTPSSLAASDLFAEDLRSSPPRIVELRRIFDDAQKAMERSEIAEDEFGEPIPHAVRRALHFAKQNLCAEEARATSPNAENQATASAKPDSCDR